MATFTQRLVHRVTRELRYAEGMRCMYAEREREYLLDQRLARLAGDSRREGEIGADLAAFGVEIHRLELKRDSADRRLRALLGGEGFRESA